VNTLRNKWSVSIIVSSILLLNLQSQTRPSEQGAVWNMFGPVGGPVVTLGT
jgi:hypothetical protein